MTPKSDFSLFKASISFFICANIKKDSYFSFFTRIVSNP